MTGNVVETMPMGERDYIGGGHPVVERITSVRFEVPGARVDEITGKTMPVLVFAPGVPADLPVGSTVTVSQRWVDDQRIDYTGTISGPPLVVCDPSFGASSLGGTDRRDGRVHVGVTLHATLTARHVPGQGTEHYAADGTVTTQSW